MDRVIFYGDGVGAVIVTLHPSDAVSVIVGCPLCAISKLAVREEQFPVVEISASILVEVTL